MAGCPGATEHPSVSWLDATTHSWFSTMKENLIFAFFSALAGVAPVSGHHLGGTFSHQGIPKFSMVKSIIADEVASCPTLPTLWLRTRASFMVLHILQLLLGASGDAATPISVARGCCHDYNIHCAAADLVPNLPTPDTYDAAVALALGRTSTPCIQPRPSTTTARSLGNHTRHRSHSLRPNA